MEPTAGTPRFFLKLKPTIAAQYGLNTQYMEMGFSVQQTPIGANFQFFEHRGSGWQGGALLMNPIQNIGAHPWIQEINSMGMKAWMQARICPLVKPALQAAYGAILDTGSAPAPIPTDPVTGANFVDRVNAGLGSWEDRDGDGLPELYPFG